LDKDRSSIFVRNICFDVDSRELEELCEEYGPVRRCILVHGKGEAQHRGYGFVQYALKEDAERAAKDLNGKQVGKRKLKVEVALKRKALGAGNLRKRLHHQVESGRADDEDAVHGADSVAKKQSKTVIRGSSKVQRSPDEVTKSARTMILGTPAEISAQNIKKILKKHGKVESVSSPLTDEELQSYGVERKECGSYAVLVQFAAIKHCIASVERTHRVFIPGRPVTGKGDKPQSQFWARQAGGEGAKWKRWRVIVRNLGFKVTFDEIMQKFGEVGFVWDLNVPPPVPGKVGNNRGFAFVAYACKVHAEKAISELSGAKLSGRVMAVDWALGKQKYRELALERNANTGKAGDGEEELDHGAQDGDETASEDENAGDDGDSHLAEAFRDGHSVGEENDEGFVEERTKSRRVLDNIMERFGDQASKVAETEEAQKRRRPQQDGPPLQAAAATGGKDVDQEEKEDEIERTLFVRNLPLEVTKSDLYQFFSKFGKLRACRPVIAKGTGRPKGTAFVQFVFEDCAQRALDEAARDGGKLIIGGQAALVSLAMTGKDAKAFMSAGNKSKLPQDKRNLYLMKEGYIAEDSEAAQGLSKSDLEKRKQGMEDKKQKMKSPNFFISKTRLSVRNIPHHLTEKELKSICLDAVRERAAKQAGRIAIKQVKILLDGDRTNKDGTPKNKGSGFVEFKEHEHALLCLRAINNNPKTFRADRRPIVEFAVEDVRVIKKREAIKAKQVQRQANHDEQPSSGKRGHDGEDEEQRAVKKQKNAKHEKAHRVVGREQADRKKGSAKATIAVEPANRESGIAEQRRHKRTREEIYPAQPKSKSPKQAIADHAGGKAKRNAEGPSRRQRKAMQGSPAGQQDDKLDDLINKHLGVDGRKAKVPKANRVEAEPTVKKGKSLAPSIHFHNMQRWFD